MRKFWTRKSVGEEAYKLLFKYTIAAMAITSLEGKVLFVNDYMVKFFGYNKGELYDLYVPDLYVNPEERKLLIKKLKVEKMIDNFHIQLVKKNGEKFWASNAVRVIHYRGEPAILSTMIDISKEKMVAQELEKMKNEKEKIYIEAQRIEKLDSIGTLAGGIAHDFNNILAVIQGRASMAISDKKLSDRTKRHIDSIINAAEKAASLTNSLLTFSKGGAPVKESANLEKIVKDTVEFCLSGSNVSYTFSFSLDLKNVDVDKNQISQVIQNLVMNANQAMPTGGLITLKAENWIIPMKSHWGIPHGCYVKLTIKDTGIGIPKDHIEKIWNPYYTTKAGGSGLGMMVCHNIIKKHNGYISVESELGKGTSFYLYIPVSKKETQELKVEDEIFKGKGERILIMDDDKQILTMLKGMLIKLKYKCIISSNGKDAIKKYKLKKIDLVVLDLTVKNGMGGEECAEKLREINPNVKLMISSGYSNNSLMSRHKENGFQGMLMKPYKFKDLSKTIYNILN